jgi:hypothetical protein
MALVDGLGEVAAELLRERLLQRPTVREPATLKDLGDALDPEVRNPRPVIECLRDDFPGCLALLQLDDMKDAFAVEGEDVDVSAELSSNLTVQDEQRPKTKDRDLLDENVFETTLCLKRCSVDAADVAVVDPPYAYLDGDPGTLGDSSRTRIRAAW